MKLKSKILCTQSTLNSVNKNIRVLSGMLARNTSAKDRLEAELHKLKQEYKLTNDYIKVVASNITQGLYKGQSGLARLNVAKNYLNAVGSTWYCDKLTSGKGWSLKIREPLKFSVEQFRSIDKLLSKLANRKYLYGYNRPVARYHFYDN